MIYAFAYAARERPKIIRSAAMALITFFRGVLATAQKFSTPKMPA